MHKMQNRLHIFSINNNVKSKWKTSIWVNPNGTSKLSQKSNLYTEIPPLLTIPYQKMATLTCNETTAQANYNKQIRKQTTLLDHCLHEFPLWSAIIWKILLGALHSFISFYILFCRRTVTPQTDTQHLFPHRKTAFDSLIWSVSRYNSIRNIKEKTWTQEQHLQISANKSATTN